MGAGIYRPGALRQVFPPNACLWVGRKSAKYGCMTDRLCPYQTLGFMCRIPDDCIDSKRYPLFIARTVLRELIESLEPTGSVKP